MSIGTAIGVGLTAFTILILLAALARLRGSQRHQGPGVHRITTLGAHNDRFYRGGDQTPYVAGGTDFGGTGAGDFGCAGAGGAGSADCGS